MLNKIKSIPEIYNEIKDYDLVICVDPALATALNKSIRVPSIGGFSFTPKELAAKNVLFFLEDNILDANKVVLEIYNTFKLKNSKIDINFIHNTYLKIIDIYKNKGAIAQIPAFLNNDELPIFEVYNTLNTIELAMERFNFEEVYFNKKVAVIGLSFFTELDKNILPLNNNYDIISIFKSDTNIEEFNSFYSFYNNKELIDQLIYLINENNQDDVAIILNTNSSILPIIKSKLNIKGIDLCVRENLFENTVVRDFINIIELAYSLDTLKIKDVILILNLLNLDIKSEYYNIFLKSFKNRKLQTNSNLINLNLEDNKDLKKVFFDFYNILESTQKNNLKYSTLYYFFINNNLDIPFQLRNVLDDLHLFNKNINLENLKELKYYITYLETIIHKSKKGVLLVDCKNSMYIDRAICFYIGLDNTWVNTITAKSYKDSKIQDQKAQDKFKIIIQQGDVNYYFVTKFSDNKENNPCFYFMQIFNKSIIDFNDPVFNIKEIKFNNSNTKNNGLIFTDSDFDYKQDLFSFSKSTLNAFTLCPKKMDFQKILPRQENLYTKKGTLLHDFCEFYIEHSSFVKEKGVDLFLNIILNEYSSFVNKIDLDLERTNIKIALMNSIIFLDNLHIESHDLLSGKNNYNIKSKSKNVFVQKLGLELKSKNSEVYFENKLYNLKGIIDLVVNNSLIIDYKSSKSKKRVSQLFKSSNLDLVISSNVGNDNSYNNNSSIINIDFQSLIYILNVNNNSFLKNKDRFIEFYYYFPFNNKNDIIKSGIDEFSKLSNLDTDKGKSFEKNIVYVKYYPMYFKDFMKTNDFLKLLKNTTYRREYLKSIDSNVILNYFKKNELNIDLLNLDITNYKATDWYKQLFNYLETLKSDKKKIESICNQVYKIRFCDGISCVLFFKEDMDHFIDFLNNQQKLVRTYINTLFPYAPIKNSLCKNCSYNTICLKRFE